MSKVDYLRNSRNTSFGSCGSTALDKAFIASYSLVCMAQNVYIEACKISNLSLCFLEACQLLLFEAGLFLGRTMSKSGSKVVFSKLMRLPIEDSLREDLSSSPDFGSPIAGPSRRKRGVEETFHLQRLPEFQPAKDNNVRRARLPTPTSDSD